MKKNSTYLLIFSVIILLAACGDKSEITELGRYTDKEWAVLENVLNIPEQPYEYDVEMPVHFANFGVFNTQIHVDKDMATLGRVLFYDKKLSANNKVSCASCHTQADAFSDKVAFSDGFEGVKTKRNSFALGTVPNMVSFYGSGQSRFFWDERAGTIEEQCQMTISDPIEMGMNLDDLPSKLEQEEHYRILFEKAFKQEKIEKFFVFAAISQFLSSFSSTETRFDEGLATTFNPTADFPNFTAQENTGKTIFNNNCSSCHGNDQISIVTFTANNGLEMNYTDKGIGSQTGEPSLNGVFKVPLLRNVALTAPYMHDGRFTTLEAVIDHYSNGIVNHQNLHPNLKNGNASLRMNFTQAEKQALIAYLNTLTDENFTKDVRYSNPFK